MLWHIICSFLLQPNKAFKKVDVEKKKEELEKVKTKYGLHTDERKWTTLYRNHNFVYVFCILIYL